MLNEVFEENADRSKVLTLILSDFSWVKKSSWNRRCLTLRRWEWHICWCRDWTRVGIGFGVLVGVEVGCVVPVGEGEGLEEF